MPKLNLDFASTVGGELDLNTPWYLEARPGALGNVNAAYIGSVQQDGTLRDEEIEVPASPEGAWCILSIPALAIAFEFIMPDIDASLGRLVREFSTVDPLGPQPGPQGPFFVDIYIQLPVADDRPAVPAHYGTANPETGVVVVGPPPVGDIHWFNSPLPRRDGYEDYVLRGRADPAHSDDLGNARVNWLYILSLATGPAGARGADGPPGGPGPAGPVGPAGAPSTLGFQQVGTSITLAASASNANTFLLSDLEDLIWLRVHSTGDEWGGFVQKSEVDDTTKTLSFQYDRQAGQIFVVGGNATYLGFRNGTGAGQGNISISVFNVFGGNEGPAGPEGATGATGPAGAQGDTGPRGLTGPTGPTGAAGADGARGPAGADGAAGATGPKGDRGADGPTGPKGDQGEQGPYTVTIYRKGATTAPTGGSVVVDGAAVTPPTGWSVNAGDATGTGVLKASNARIDPATQSGTVTPTWSTPFDAGGSGPAGPPGEKGDTGDTGAQGPKGDDGPAGPKGDTGATGPAGAKGDPGAKGDKGDKGDTGAAGAAGADGAAGAKGDQGPRGLQGDKGDTGPAGPGGAKGDKGDPGTQVTANPAGTDGADLNRLAIAGTNYNIAGSGGGDDDGELVQASVAFAAAAAPSVAAQRLETLQNTTVSGSADVFDITSTTNWGIVPGTYIVEARLLLNTAGERAMVTLEFGQWASGALKPTALWQEEPSAFAYLRNDDASVDCSIPPFLITVPDTNGDGTAVRGTIWMGQTENSGAGDANFQARAGSTIQLTRMGGGRGPQGPAGPAGGPAGPKGDKGDTGATGAKGDPGATGARGPQGIQGVKGDTGDTGPAGADGTQVEANPAGSDGDPLTRIAIDGTNYVVSSGVLTQGDLGLVLIGSVDDIGGTPKFVGKQGGGNLMRSDLNPLILIDLTYTRTNAALRMSGLVRLAEITGTGNYNFQVQGAGGDFIALSFNAASAAGVMRAEYDGSQLTSGTVNMTVYNVAGGTPGVQGPKGDQGATGPAGAKGDKGDKGDRGATGAAGPGVASGGSNNQGLLKNGATNFQTKWGNVVLPATTGTAVHTIRVLTQTQYDAISNKDANTLYLING